MKNEDDTTGCMVKIPPGHILIHEKWRGSNLISVLQASTRVLFEEELGIVDFKPSSQTAVIYISEGDLIIGSAYKKSVVKLRNIDKVRGVVIVEKTTSTNQYFSDLQDFVTIRVGMFLIPVTSQEEAASFLSQMVEIENRPGLNQLRVKRKATDIDSCVLTTLLTVPKLGQVKAKALLTQFKSIKAISEQSLEELSKVIGKSSAVHVLHFFNKLP